MIWIIITITSVLIAYVFTLLYNLHYTNTHSKDIFKEFRIPYLFNVSPTEQRKEVSHFTISDKSFKPEITDYVRQETPK